MCIHEDVTFCCGMALILVYVSNSFVNGNMYQEVCL